MVEIKLKKYIFLLFILFENFMFSMTLSNVKGIDKLKNYDVVKNIEIERIAEKKRFDSKIRKTRWNSVFQRRIETI